jgi:L-seryl-tRNA(Ser) seleniumtransferase
MATTHLLDSFTALGVKPLINACGIYTDLGGSVLSPRVWAAMEEVNRSFVRIVDLLERSGQTLAAMVEAPAARVVPGASAAITLATAACMAGLDGRAWERLPDTTGLKSDVLIQKAHRYKYDRMVRIAGARLIEVGPGDATPADISQTYAEQMLASAAPSPTTAADLERAITPNTAMVIFPAHLAGKPGTVDLPTVSAIAQRHGLPVFVDAAYMNYPTSIMSSYLKQGADLAGFSAKYFWGPNSGGFLCGRHDLIDAVAGVDFTGYESGQYLSFGRPWKLDRQIIVGTVVALQEWFEMDHDARWRGYRQQVAEMQAVLGDIPNIHTEPRYFTMDERLIDEPVNCLALTLPGGANEAERLSETLLQGEPSIATVVVDSKLVAAVDTLLPGQNRHVAKALKTLLCR